MTPRVPPAGMNRRSFLAAAGASIVATSLARAQDLPGDEPADLAGGDVEPVRVAVIGTGGRGSDLIRRITTIEGANLVAICDDYAPHLKAAGEFAGKGARPYSDYRKMIDEAKPQAVIVAVPLYLHAPVSIDAMDAGCDVFCEKMMCHDLDQGRAMAAKVAERKAVFQLGLQRRSNPIYTQARSMIEAGMLGRISAIKAQWHRNGNWRRPVPVPRDDKRWTDLERRLNWRLFSPYSRGLLSELGSHQIDVANWMLNALPKRCYATGGIDYWRDGREVPDNVFCTFEYDVSPAAGDRDDVAKDPYTVRVTYSSLCNNAFEGASELVMGTRGSVLLTEPVGLLYGEKQENVGWAKAGGGADTNAAVVTSGKTLGFANDPWAHRGKPAEIQNEVGDPTRDQLVSFLDCVRRRDVQTVCDVRTGLLNTATVLMAVNAMERGTVVEFPKDVAARRT
jgi:predicted dehydrogenase